MIESNISNELNINKIANTAFVSPMQLYRDFYSITGHSVKEYVRRRRLSNALSFIKHSDMSLADIAYFCGYSSQQAFCKSVKAVIGQTPLEYKDSDNFYYFPCFNNKTKQQITVTTETIPQTICLKFYHNQLRGIENRAVNMLMKTLPDYNGRIYGRNGKQNGNSFCYELFIERNDLSDLDGFTIGDFVPELTATFGKTTVKNIESEINSAWDYLYIDWLKTSMFTQDDKPYFEEYIITSVKIKKLVLYLPMRKLMDYNKISLKFCNDMPFLVSTKSGVNAEENASKAVMNFLSNYNPYLIKTARQFFVCHHGYEYTCGIKINSELKLPQDSELTILRFDACNYAILEGDCCSDSSVYETILLSWITENGFIKDNTPVFTIYETDGSFEQKNIKTKIFIKLKKCYKRIIQERI